MTDLPSSIPELQTDCPVLEVHGLGEKVDADSGLVGVIEGIVHLVFERC
jgi:hypothetical protein